MKGTRILVIDDDTMARKILSDFFSHEGCVVSCAGNGEEGMALFEKGKPDIIILDILLPGMTGFEILKHIKSTPQGKHTPVIFISAVYKSPEFQDSVLKTYDIAAYLSKPFKLNDLWTQVLTLMRDRG